MPSPLPAIAEDEIDIFRKLFKWPGEPTFSEWKAACAHVDRLSADHGFPIVRVLINAEEAVGFCERRNLSQSYMSLCALAAEKAAGSSAPARNMGRAAILSPTR